MRKAKRPTAVDLRSDVIPLLKIVDVVLDKLREDETLGGDESSDLALGTGWLVREAIARC